MPRALSVLVLVWCALAMGCGGGQGEYKAAGAPALKFELRAASTGKLPGSEAVDDPDWREPPAGVFALPRKPLFVTRETVITNADVASTGVKHVKKAPEVFVAVWLTDAGKAKLAKLSRDLVPPKRDEETPRGRVAILIDGKLVSAPVVMAQVTNGQFTFSGNYTEPEARKVAKGIVGP